MDNVYFDIESGKTVTIDQLKTEYIESIKNNPKEFINVSFPEYIENCLTENNGTLERIRPKINQDFFKGFRRLMGYDENGQPIWHINK